MALYTTYTCFFSSPRHVLMARRIIYAAKVKGRKLAAQLWKGQEQFRQGRESWQRQMQAAHPSLNGYEKFERS